MSLEQLRGDKDIDQRADVYAFGVMLYEAVTGRLPYEAETLPELAIKVATTDPPPVKSLRADIPTPLARLIDYAVARDRNQRMPTVRTLMQELEVFARDHTFREQMTQREAPMPRLAAETRELSGDSVTLLRDPEPARKPPPLAAAKQPGLRSDPDTFRVREVISSARPRRKRWTVGISAAIVGLLVAGVWLFNQRSQPQPTDIDAASAGAPVATPALPAPTVAAPTPLAAPGGAAELHPTPIQARPEPRAAAAKPSEPADNPEVVAAPASPPSQPAVPHKQPVAPSSPKPAVRPPTAPAPSNKISTAALPALTKPAPVTSVSKTPPAVLPPPAPAKKKSSLDLVGF
jgi:serine/threonine-protein kinase